MARVLMTGAIPREVVVALAKNHTLTRVREEGQDPYKVDGPADEDIPLEDWLVREGFIEDKREVSCQTTKEVKGCV
jgi:hypothetical protein